MKNEIVAHKDLKIRIEEGFFNDVKFLFVEGYLWSSQSAQNAIRKAVEFSKRKDELFMGEMLTKLEDRELGRGASKYWNKMREHLDWFMKHNAKAYMVLLD